MKLKKTNAVFALFSFIALLTHMGYNTYAYLTMYYNPFLTKLISYTTAACTIVHAVLGMISVFTLTDGTNVSAYPKLNRATLIQRVTAAFIFPLLILHIQAFGIMSANAEAGRAAAVIIVMILEVLFFAVVASHAAVSVTKALVTLGLLSSEKTMKKLDIAVYIICGIMFAAVSAAVTRGCAIMFLH